MSNPTNAPTVLNDHDRARLAQVMGRMPYAAGLIPQWRETTVDNLINTLELLANRLREHAASCEKRDAELEETRRLIAGGRRLLRALMED